MFEEIINEGLDRLIISNPKNKDVKFQKIIMRPIKLKDEIQYQFEKYTQKQAFHENCKLDKALKLLDQLMEEYRQCDVFTSENNYTIKISKKGKVFKHVTPNKTKVKVAPVEHNRTKNYLIPEGTFIEPLYDLGVMSKDGKIIHAMYDKYKQINRFIEMIDDCLYETMKHLNIIDFGCGKAYLTFILYYYLVEVKGIKVNMIGLDLKEDVIAECNDVAKKYGYQDLHFEVGDINGYKTDLNIDMVISLHACDVATDFALYNAISWGAKMIFSVPCCQHELNKQIKTDEFKMLTRYGLLKERFAAILTDEIRANLLEYMGYHVQVLEFIDMVHSPKNILLRCVKGEVSEAKRAKVLKEVEDIIKTFNLEPTLYKLLIK